MAWEAQLQYTGTPASTNTVTVPIAIPLLLSLTAQVKSSRPV